MKKTFFITVILLGFSYSTASVINPIDRDQCFRERASTLTEAGQTAYSQMTGLHIVRYTQLAPGESVPLNTGRRLNPVAQGEGQRTEESFVEDGKECTGYTVNEGQKYCKQPFKQEDGSQGCKEWDTIYQGSACEEWAEEKVKVTTNAANSSEVTNPEFIKVQQELKKQEKQVDHFKNLYDELDVRKEVEIKNLKNTLEQRWTQVEHEWIKNQSNLLSQKQAELSGDQEVQLTKMLADYQKNIHTITQQWLS